MKAKKGRHHYFFSNTEERVIKSALHLVSRWSEYPKSEIMSRRREEPLVDARHLWWMLCNRTRLFSLVRLGAIVGRDHGTIIHAIKRHRNRLETSKRHREAWAELCKEFDKLSVNRNRYNAAKNADSLVQEQSVHDG